MKEILAYGQACRRYRLGKADGLECLQKAFAAQKAGYNVRALETIAGNAGNMLRKRKGYVWGGNNNG